MTTKIQRKNGKAFIVTKEEIYMASNGCVQFAVHFESGGWNSVWARTSKQALALAKKEYAYSDILNVASVSIMTESKERALLRSFY